MSTISNLGNTLFPRWQRFRGKWGEKRRRGAAFQGADDGATVRLNYSEHFRPDFAGADAEIAVAVVIDADTLLMQIPE
jgi:hypothetical protein